LSSCQAGAAPGGAKGEGGRTDEESGDAVTNAKLTVVISPLYVGRKNIVKKKKKLIVENKKVKSGHESANVNSSHKSFVFRQEKHSGKKRKKVHSGK
jgi:hypothetical protein